ncbi:MAG: T9SS type A sorting domain-containing protein [Flavobacteriales bacterium]
MFFLAATAIASAQSPAHVFPHEYTLLAMHADIIPLSAGEKVALADAIIEGEVVATRSFWKNNRIVSTLTIASETVLYHVELIGGAFQDMGAFCTGEMYLNIGAKGTFYLIGSHADGWKPACGVQSYEPFEHDVLTMGFNRSTVELSTDWAAGNGMEMLTIIGTGFGADQGNGYVTFETGGGYYDADAAVNFNYTEWSNTSITVEVPQAQSNRVRVITHDGTTLESTDSLHIRYNLDSEPFSPYGYTHLYNNNGDGSYLFYVNEVLFNEPERLEAVERTLDDFVCKTGVNFQLSDAPTSLGWDLGDGQNTISFDTPDNPLSPGTVGYCNTLWWSCILDDVTFYVAGEIDIVLNSNFDYEYGTGDLTTGNAKFAYVLMHELGHAMRLGHVNEWGESMYPSVTDWPSQNWFERDTISTNDRLGVLQVVDIASTFTFNACGIAVMEPLDIDCEPTVEVAEGEETASPEPYPNPFDDFINLPTTAVWTLMDITGKVVQRIPATGNFIATEGLPAGCYLLQSLGTEGNQTYRLIKE